MASMRMSAGFTLLELIVVLLISALLFTLGGPSVRALYDSMQYREAVRELVSAAKSGRLKAQASGQPIDLLIDTKENGFVLTDKPLSIEADQFGRLPEALDITVVYAREVSTQPGMAAQGRAARQRMAMRAAR